MSSPTIRTIAKMKKEGYIIGVVERFIKMGRFGMRKDLFGFIDLIACRPEESGTVGVQTTSGSNFSAHIHKILDNEEIRLNAVTWVSSGNRILLHGWRKVGPRGKRKLWECREQELTLSDLNYCEVKKNEKIPVQ